MKTIKRLVRTTLNRFGYDIVSMTPASSPRNPLVDQLITHDISVVFDVGANIGQFARQLRDYGYAGKIVSFEPVKASFDRLSERARADSHWKALNIALGAFPQTVKINVSRNSVSSSIRPLEEKILAIEPAAEYVSVDLVRVESMDNLFTKYSRSGDRTFLKLDVQGYENEVLKGAQRCLREFRGVLLEASLSPVYQGEWLFHDVVEYFLSRGFILSHLENVFEDQSAGQLLQVDALFWRTVATAGKNGPETGV